MMQSDKVRLNGTTLVPVCPYHGPQPDAVYSDCIAPCGCWWYFDHSGLWALQPGVLRINGDGCSKFGRDSASASQTGGIG